jgi:hypothetical protein
MDWKGWTYVGDRNVRHGGFWWAARPGDGEVVDVLRVSPHADAGGPDNVFGIQIGEVSITPGRGLDDARAFAGLTGGDVSVGDDVAAVLGFSGFGNIDSDWSVRIGPEDPLWSGRDGHPEVDVVLRDGTSLRKWLQREYLHAPEGGAQPAYLRAPR